MRVCANVLANNAVKPQVLPLFKGELEGVLIGDTDNGRRYSGYRGHFTMLTKKFGAHPVHAIHLTT